MKKILSTLLALPLALLLAFAVFSAPAAKAHADETIVSDAQFVDGNWFQIAEDQNEAYKVGSPTEVALQAQLTKYQDAVEEKDAAKAEKYAIRSWVKANFAAQQGLEAAEAGKAAEAKGHYDRALKYAKAAQKKGAGLGELESRGHDDTAPTWAGDSAVEGKRAEKYVKKLLKRLPKEVRGADAE